MDIAIAVVVILVVAVVVGVAMRIRGGSAAEIAPPRAPRPEPEPMTDLEDALAQVTDRTGTSMRDRLESTTVDELRDIDDTGPLLGRALDHVNPADASGAGDTLDDADPDSAPPG